MSWWLLGSSLLPTPDAFEADLARLQDLLARAEAIGSTTARVQNALAQQLAVGTPLCEEGLARRSDVFGAEHRVAAQSALTLAAALRSSIRSPTIQPLLEGGWRPDADVAVQRGDVQAQRHAEFAAWHKKHAAGTSRCPDLVPMDGLPAQTPDDGAIPPAVLVLDGVFCPVSDQAVVVASSGCIATTLACDCEPQALLPGQVLGLTTAE